MVAKLSQAFDEVVRSPKFVGSAEKVGLNLAVAEREVFRRAVATQAIEVRALMKQLGVTR